MDNESIHNVTDNADLHEDIDGYYGNYGKYTNLQIVIMAFVSFILLVGIPGNSLVIYIFGIRRHKKRSRFELLLLLLGIVDFISVLIVPTSFLYSTVVQYQRWHFGLVACKIIPSSFQISVTMSQGLLLLICFQRYRAIVQPFRNQKFTNVQILLWLMSFMILSIILVYPYAYSLDIPRPPDYELSTCQPRADKIRYASISPYLHFARDIVSVLIMASLSHRMSNVLIQNHNMLNVARATKHFQRLKLIKVVVITFSVLCLPLDFYQVVYYTMTFQGVTLNDNISEILYSTNTILNLLQTSNSVANIFIYSRMHIKFRSALFRLRTRTLHIAAPSNTQSVMTLDSLLYVPRTLSTDREKQSSF